MKNQIKEGLLINSFKITKGRADNVEKLIKQNRTRKNIKEKK